MTGGFMYARPWYYNSKYPYKDIFSEYYMLAMVTMNFGVKIIEIKNKYLFQ